jgi:hypothetical protein
MLSTIIIFVNLDDDMRMAVRSTTAFNGGAVIATIERLGHVGPFLRDVDVMMRVYSEVLGLRIADIDENAGLYLLNPRPTEEHHELLLYTSRTEAADALLLQRLSSKCPYLDEVIEVYGRLVEGRREDRVHDHA